MKTAVGHKIIIEGVDGSGKSTLAKKIADESGIDYKIVHCTRNTKNDLRFFLDLLESEDNIIFDRFHIGQFIYQSGEDRYKKKWLSLGDLEIIENCIESYGFELIFVDTDSDTVLRNCLKDRDDSYFDIDYVNSLRNKYKYFFENITSCKYRYEFIDMGNSVENDDSARNCDYSKLPKIVAVDFDGCLVKGATFPNIGHLNETLVHDLFHGIYKDYKKILWTSRNGAMLREAIQFLQDNGIYFDAYNDNLPEAKQMTGNNTRKVYADIYIDDKAVVY